MDLGNSDLSFRYSIKSLWNLGRFNSRISWVAKRYCRNDSIYGKNDEEFYLWDGVSSFIGSFTCIFLWIAASRSTVWEIKSIFSSSSSPLTKKAFFWFSEISGVPLLQIDEALSMFRMRQASLMGGGMNPIYQFRKVMLKQTIWNKSLRNLNSLVSLQKMLPSLNKYLWISNEHEMESS